MLSSKNPTQYPSSVGEFFIFLLSVCTLMLIVNRVDCRYLPTRADERDVEVLRDIIDEVSSLRKRKCRPSTPTNRQPECSKVLSKPDFNQGPLKHPNNLRLMPYRVQPVNQNYRLLDMNSKFRLNRRAAEMGSFDYNNQDRRK